MRVSVGIASSVQTGGGGGAAHHDLFSCLGLLIALIGLPLLSYAILKARSFAKGSGKDKPDFTSLRSTGKTIVNDEDDDDPSASGGVT